MEPFFICKSGRGCGRLTRHLLDNADDPANVHGIDIDPDNIKWCKQNLAEGSFDHVGLYPPTELEGRFFNMMGAYLGPEGVEMRAHLRSAN